MLRAAALGMLFSMAALARADIVDRIDIQPVNGEAEVRVGFTIPMHYVRHFPKSSGEIIEIFFESASIDGKDTERRSPPVPETKKSPPSDLVPPFTITPNPFLADVKPKTTESERDPLRLTVQFDRPVEFRLVEGRDERSFSLFIKRLPANNSDTR